MPAYRGSLEQSIGLAIISSAGLFMPPVFSYDLLLCGGVFPNFYLESVLWDRIIPGGAGAAALGSTPLECMSKE